MEAMLQKPQPVWLFTGRGRPGGRCGKGNRIYGELNLSYLTWRTDPDETRREITALQAQLGQLYAARGSDLQWLMSLAERQGTLTPVTLGRNVILGRGSGHRGRAAGAGALHEQRASGAIDDFYKEIEEAWPDAPLLAKNKSEFDARYRALSFDAWKAFADGFAGGTARLNSPKDMQEAAARMAQDGGPYFALLNRITTEFEPLATGGQLPPWLAQVLQFQLIRAQGFAQEGEAR